MDDEVDVSINETGPPGEAGAPGQEGEGGKTEGAGEGEDSLEQPEWSEEGPAEWEGEEEGVAQPATCSGSRYGADLWRRCERSEQSSHYSPDGILMSD